MSLSIMLRSYAKAKVYRQLDGIFMRQFRWLFRKRNSSSNPFLVFRQFFLGLQKSFWKFWENIQPPLSILKDDAFRSGKVLVEVLRVFIVDCIKKGLIHFIYILEKSLLKNGRALNQCATFIMIVLALIIIKNVIEYFRDRREKKKIKKKKEINKVDKKNSYDSTKNESKSWEIL
jgi:hypothetical protein